MENHDQALRTQRHHSALPPSPHQAGSDVLIVMPNPRPMDLHHLSRAHRDSAYAMETQRSKRASLERQTQLAHIKLISKYYGYESLARPKTDDDAPGAAAGHQHRRAGHSYPGHPTERAVQPDTEKRTSEPILNQQQQQQQQQQQKQRQPSGSPSRRRRPPVKTLGRTSCGSDGSTPSLIEDRTDSEVSHDDDYQYHASTSQLWDSFWAGQKGDGARARHHRGGIIQHPSPAKATEGHAQDRDQDQNQDQDQQPTATTRYPALIPSPHIKRTKKTSIISYDDENLPPRPVQYSIPVHQPEDDDAAAVATTTKDNGPKKSLPPQWPSAATAEEKQKTIRTVKSSYSLFPRQTAAAPPPPLPPLPPSPALFMTSLPRPSTGTPAPVTFQRKTSRPQPIHIHSDPLPRIPEPLEAPSIPVRPHTSHGGRTSGPSTSIPLFPSTNLVNLINPRSAPLPPAKAPVAPVAPATTACTPPNPSASGPGRYRRLFTGPRSIPQSLTLTNQKSVFDFDSDSDEDTPEPPAPPPPPPSRGIARMMKKSRKSKGDAEVSSSAEDPAAHPASSSDDTTPLPRASAERMRRRKSRTNLALLGRKAEDGEAPLLSPALPEDRERKKHDVFGRMFGRGRH